GACGSLDDHNSNSFDCPPDSYHPPHPKYETYSVDFCGNDSQSGYDCPPQVFEIKDALGTTKNKLEDLQELFRELSNDVQNIHEELAEYINTPGWNRPAFYDDDDDVDYTIALTPNETVDSLIMGNKHLDTILATESNEFIKSSVENLVPNPSE
nr:hypothetical protein [Tanacetum cinerariifolium]